MTRRSSPRALGIGMLALALVACGGHGGDNATAGDTASAGNTANGGDTASGGDNAGGADQRGAAAPPAPTPMASPSPRTLAELPSTMRGRWALTDADCDPARADAKGLMVAAPTMLTFDEARATVTAASLVAPDRVGAQLSFSGDGRRWQRLETLTLLDDGRTLIREERQPAAAYRYSRCPD